MAVTIVSKEEQAMLGRTTIVAKASFEGKTPKRDNLRKEVAKAAKVKEEGLIIKSIQTHYGGLNAEITAEYYEKLDDAKAVVHKSLIEKHAKKEKPKAEETPAEAAPVEKASEEKPAEEATVKVDEPKVEKPSEDAPAKEVKADEPVAEKKKEE